MYKYRVKNCPAISFAGGCRNGEVKVWDCQDCTDCLLKQIVKKCKKSLEVSYCPIEQEILELLDIQECE